MPFLFFLLSVRQNNYFFLPSLSFFTSDGFQELVATRPPPPIASFKGREPGQILYNYRLYLILSQCFWNSRFSSFFFFFNFLNGKKLLRQCQHDSGCLFSGHLVMPLSGEEELWQPGSLLLLCPELHCHPGEESATNAASVCVRVCVSVRVCKGLVFLHACTKLFFFWGGSYLGNKVFCARSLYELFTFAGAQHKSCRQKESCDVWLKSYVGKGGFLRAGGGGSVPCLGPGGAAGGDAGEVSKCPPTV